MIQLHLGDARQIVPTLTMPITAVISDPPYGGRFDTDYTRFTGGLSQSRHYEDIVGDDQPFDPTPWLAYPKVVLWGYQFFASRLPLGTILVWCKRRENQLGKFLSDCELAWCKGGKGCYLFNHVWNGFDRASERDEKSLHPSQKPVALMEWCIDRLKLTSSDVVLDPYMGTGCVGVACRRRGIGYIGCEVVPGYFEIAQQRIERFADYFSLAQKAVPQLAAINVPTDQKMLF